MTIFGYRPILEIPSLDVTGTINVNKNKPHHQLEDVAKRDFGETGLAQLKEYNVQVDAPINISNFHLSFTRSGQLLGGPSNDAIGKVYDFFSREIHGVSSAGAGVEVDQLETCIRLMLTLDLNPELPERYLRLVFPFWSDGRGRRGYLSDYPYF